MVFSMASMVPTSVVIMLFSVSFFNLVILLGMMAEALGMSLPGCASIPAPYRERGQMAYRTGRRIVAMVEEDLKPSDVMTRAAFDLSERHEVPVLLHFSADRQEGRTLIRLKQPEEHPMQGLSCKMSAHYGPCQIK